MHQQHTPTNVLGLAALTGVRLLNAIRDALNLELHSTLARLEQNGGHTKVYITQTLAIRLTEDYFWSNLWVFDERILLLGDG
jgi:hypothetical protein